MSILRSYCNYESDNFEAWNNLSNAYIKQGQKARAWKVLQEAVKCDYDNWKVWENVLIVSIDCCHYEEAIKAYNRIIDIKEKHLDVQVLSILVEAINSDLLDNYERPSSRLEPEASKLFGRLATKMPTEGQIWLLYSDLIKDDEAKKIRLLQKGHACLSQKANWEKDIEKAKEVTKAALKYCDGVLRSNELSQASSAKMSLRTTLMKVKKGQVAIDSGNIEDEALKELVESLESGIENVLSHIESIKN